MPGGTISGAQASFVFKSLGHFLSQYDQQFMKTSAYIQVTGRFNQTGVGLAANDTGGELDPHGADLVCISKYHHFGLRLKRCCSWAIP